MAWPNGNITKLTDVKANQTLTIAYEASAIVENTPKQKSDNKLFQTIDVPDLFTHEENKFNDFEVEVLLPHKNSTLGPTLATGDLNGDGLEDYIVWCSCWQTFYDIFTK